MLLTKCANISPPTGGPKDLQEPKVKSRYPENKTTNFKDKVLLIEFDEEITLNNINQEIQFTPSIGNNYKITNKKNTVKIELTETLKDNTTYRINFNKGIKDLTEGNIAKDLIIIFSTGNSLDSLYINGNVKSVANNKKAEAIVAIYPSSDTLNIFKDKPYIYTKTNDGKYSLENIKSGKYDIIAFEDLNNNNIVDQNEKFGFNNTAIELNKSISELNINILNRKSRDSLQIINTFVNGNKIDIDLNKGVYKTSIKSDNIYYTLSKSNKQINIYNTGNYKDSITLDIGLIDSSNNTLTKRLKFKTEEKIKRKEFPTIIPQPNSRIILNKDKIEIIFSKPIINLKRDNILKVGVDNKEVKYLSINKDYFVNEYNDKIIITNIFEAKDSIKIETDRNDLLTINNDSVYAIKAKYQIADITELGSIQGKITTEKKHFIIQLLDTKHTVIEQVKNNKDYTFSYLRPGKYFVRVIDDLNNNGIWDLGDYSKREQPEAVNYYTEEITLKENWEVLDINIHLQ